jgi:demethylmenaquinone methyltransferase/2-methoxy-6-polyprenyl-1,4-benzoquinol methylase
MARTVKPGGTLALLAHSSQQLLPGHPRLEARLDMTSAGMAPFSLDTPPDRHFFRAAGWFCGLGFTGIKINTFVQSFHAPLKDQLRRGAAALLDMRWDGAREELSGADRELFDKLTRPDSPDYVLDLPDYYGFFTYSLFKARAP